MLTIDDAHPSENLYLNDEKCYQNVHKTTIYGSRKSPWSWVLWHIIRIIIGQNFKLLFFSSYVCAFKWNGIFVLRAFFSFFVAISSSRKLLDMCRMKESAKFYFSIETNILYVANMLAYLLYLLVLIATLCCIVCFSAHIKCVYMFLEPRHMCHVVFV